MLLFKLDHCKVLTLTLIFTFLRIWFVPPIVLGKETINFNLVPHSMVLLKQNLNYQSYPVNLLDVQPPIDSSECMIENTSCFLKDIKETGKIILMATAASITYGIIHDLITTQVNFDYFASDRTHHGPFTQQNFPYVYNANNKVLLRIAMGL